MLVIPEGVMKEVGRIQKGHPEICLCGKIGDNMVVILVDSGSTHNFLDPSVISKNKLPIDEAGRL